MDISETDIHGVPYTKKRYPLPRNHSMDIRHGAYTYEGYAGISGVEIQNSNLQYTKCSQGSIADLQLNHNLPEEASWRDNYAPHHDPFDNAKLSALESMSFFRKFMRFTVVDDVNEVLLIMMCAKPSVMPKDCLPEWYDSLLATVGRIPPLEDALGEAGWIAFIFTLLEYLHSCEKRGAVERMAIIQFTGQYGLGNSFARLILHILQANDFSLCAIDMSETSIGDDVCADDLNRFIRNQPGKIAHVDLSRTLVTYMTADSLIRCISLKKEMSKPNYLSSILLNHTLVSLQDREEFLEREKYEGFCVIIVEHKDEDSAENAKSRYSGIEHSKQYPHCDPSKNENLYGNNPYSNQAPHCTLGNCRKKRNLKLHVVLGSEPEKPVGKRSTQGILAKEWALHGAKPAVNMRGSAANSGRIAISRAKANAHNPNMLDLSEIDLAYGFNNKEAVGTAGMRLPGLTKDTDSPYRSVSRPSAEPYSGAFAVPKSSSEYFSATNFGGRLSGRSRLAQLEKR